MTTRKDKRKINSVTVSLKDPPAIAIEVPLIEVSRMGNSTGKAKIGKRALFPPAFETMADKIVVAPARQAVPVIKKNDVNTIFPPGGGVIKNR